MSEASPLPSVLKDRILARVERVGHCWIWTGARDHGYGVIKIPGVQLNVRTHRAMYLLMTGPIPDGLVLDHLCRNRACCNPAHLEPVTDQVNFIRGESPTAITVRTGRCHRGHERVGKNLTRGGSCRLCLSYMNRQNWATLTPEQKLARSRSNLEAAARYRQRKREERDVRRLLAADQSN